MLGVLRNLYGAFARLPMPAQAVITVAALVAVLAGLALSVALSPLLAVLFLLAFLGCAAVFGFRLLRSRPALWWGLAGAACFVLMLAFSGVSAALYGGGGGQGGQPREMAERQPEPREETTAETRPETTAEAKEETTAGEEATEPAPEPESEPEPQPEPRPEPEPEPVPEPARFDATATVTRVVDGDTVEVSPAVAGNDTIRLIGVDTPETVDPGEPVEPYGPEASSFAALRLEGREVEVEYDSERTDPYGRLLAYVYVGDEMFNRTLVESGHAQVWFIPPNTRHEQELFSAQDGAKASGAGIWSLPLSERCQLANHGNGIGEGEPGCSGAEPPPEPQYEPNPEPSPSPSPDPGSGLPPFPGDPFNGPTCDEVGGGPYSVPAGSPRDSDGDGAACE